MSSKPPFLESKRLTFGYFNDIHVDKRGFYNIHRGELDLISREKFISLNPGIDVLRGKSKQEYEVVEFYAGDVVEVRNQENLLILLEMDEKDRIYDQQTGELVDDLNHQDAEVVEDDED